MGIVIEDLGGDEETYRTPLRVVRGYLYIRRGLTRLRASYKKNVVTRVGLAAINHIPINHRSVPQIKEHQQYFHCWCFFVPRCCGYNLQERVYSRTTAAVPSPCHRVAHIYRICKYNKYGGVHRYRA